MGSDLILINQVQGFPKKPWRLIDWKQISKFASYLEFFRRAETHISYREPKVNEWACISAYKGSGQLERFR